MGSVQSAGGLTINYQLSTINSYRSAELTAEACQLSTVNCQHGYTDNQPVT
ncbi:MAG: hypothetical protein QNJ36_00800 [Calothrix sp. MO_167.B42]|nr:hypothetical protein [Calothrix sp. MO_167.B42]